MGSRRWLGAVVAAVLVSSGCWWAQPGASPGHTFSNYEPNLTTANVATLQQVWTGRGGLGAVVERKVIGAYWTGSGVDVVAHDFDTGVEAWSRTLTPPGVVEGLPTHPPVVSGSTVWTGYQALTPANTCTFGTARLDLFSGSLLGNDTSTAATELIPFDDKVAVITRPYQLFLSDCGPSATSTQLVADGATGTTEWTTGISRPGNTLTQVGDSIFAPIGGLRRYPAAGCGAATCAPTWQTQPTGIGSINDLAGEPGGPLFALAPGGFQMGLHTIDATTGLAVGSTLLPYGATSLALADGTVFVAGDTTLEAYDMAACAAGACTLEWSATLGGQATFADGLAVAGGVVYVGRQDGVVEAFPAAGCGAATCPSLTSVSTDDTVMQLVVSQGRLYVGTIDTVTAFAPTG